MLLLHYLMAFFLFVLWANSIFPQQIYHAINVVYSCINVGSAFEEGKQHLRSEMGFLNKQTNPSPIIGYLMFSQGVYIQHTTYHAQHGTDLRRLTRRKYNFFN